MPSTEHFTKEETERVIRGEFKGLADAMELMQKRKHGPQVVGRWDWHLWMFLISTCLPCFGVYCLAMWIRADLWAKHHKREEAKQKHHEESTPDDPIQQKISSLEKELNYLRFLVLLNGTKVPPNKLFQSSKVPQEKHQERVEITQKQIPEERKTWNERMWDSIKKWLPFYVEPYFPRSAYPSQMDPTTVFKTEK